MRFWFVLGISANEEAEIEAADWGAAAAVLAEEVEEAEVAVGVEEAVIAAEDSPGMADPVVLGETNPAWKENNRVEILEKCDGTM